MRVAVLSILLVQSTLWGAAAGARPGDLSGFPAMSRDHTLPMIARALRDHLLDPSSVTNFAVCYPAMKVKITDGRPVRWTIMFSLNAKNSYGGYTGAQQLAAVFRADRPVQIVSTGMPPGLGNYGECTRVPDIEIRRLIEAE